MQGTSKLRSILPVLKKVCSSFDDKMNTEFVQVMFLLMTELPWYRYLNAKDGFQNGVPIRSKNEFNTIFRMASYTLGAYTKNRHPLADCLSLRDEDIVYFNATAEIRKPACFLALNHQTKEIITSIRGTVENLEVFRDLIIKPSMLDGGLVHSGMYDQANEVIELVKPRIDALLSCYPDYRVVFTGHSLGAGAASIATLLLQSSYPSISAYCFACPSCVSSSLLPRLQNCVVSVQNMHDLVPRISSSSMHDVKTAFEQINWKELIDSLFSERFGQTKELWQLVDKLLFGVDSDPSLQSIDFLRPSALLADYHTLNESVSMVYNTVKAYASLYDTEKSLMAEYTASIQEMIDHSLSHFKQQAEMDINAKLAAFKSVRITSIEKDCKEAIQKGLTTNEKILNDFTTQSTHLLNQLEQTTKDFGVKLQSCYDVLQKQFELTNSPDFPILHEIQSINQVATIIEKDSGLKALYNTIRSLFTNGVMKKQTKDWFPYPQLFPPGTLYHIQNNPMNGIMDDYDLLKEATMRLQQNTSAGIIPAEESMDVARLVKVGKEEFDHYSLHESLFEDHRVGNYVWGLCRVYDSTFSSLE